jgi:TonB-linked SusC/RagA family outer membrane protein
MKRIILLFVVFNGMLQFSYGQKLAVTGTVTAKEDGLPIIGASIVEKGTTNGTITNFDGVYTISVSSGATLVFSYVGMEKQEKKVAASATLNVVLSSSAIAIDEVVVTAMGVKQEKKKLNFAVQSVNSDALTDSRSANFVNSLQGKVAGVNVTNSGGSPNSGSQIIIRGISSINSSQNNQPLFIVDGMPVSGGPSSINPNDIENVTVLKGAAAAALYGQEAANGAIMITTKQGVVGKISTTVNASMQLDNAVRLPEIQQMFGTGSMGFYKPLTGGGWGPLLNENEKKYDNIGNFFQTGIYQKYDISMSGGSEKFQTYASVNYSSNEGIVPNDYLKSLGMLLKGTFQINDKFTGTVSANLTNNTSRGAGSISSVYSWPINDDITDYEKNGWPRFRYLSETAKENSPLSPLWSRYKDSGINTSTRNIMQGSLSYKPVKNLDITGRISYDLSNYSYDGYTVPRYDDSVVLPNAPKSGDYVDQELFAKDFETYNAHYNSVPFFSEEKIGSVKSNVDTRDLFGAYEYNQSKSQLLTASAMATYKIELNNDFNVEILGGTEMKMRDAISASMQGRDFIIPGIYNMSNVNEVTKVDDVSLTHRQQRIAGVFGELRGDYKGLATLSVTSRWDWSSTIAMKYNPYYYPSITGGVIFSELFGLSNDWFSYGKVRGNWARVGKDAQPYLFDRKFTQYPTLPDGGYGADPSKSVASNLMPEISDSWEIGLDARFFDNKTRLDIAYYSTYVDNQIVTVRVSPASGYILQTRNEGSIRNDGVEFTLEQNIIKKKDLSWTAAANFGLNRGLVVDLPDDIVELQGTQYGDIFPTAYLNGSTTAISGKDYSRTPDGQIIVGADGFPKINPTKSVIIGNREPDFLLGISTNLRYKDLSVSMLFDGRKGGDVVNVTGRGLWSSGQHKALEFYRGRQIVWDGVVEQADGTFKQNTTPIVADYRTITEYYAVSSNYVEDGSYIRLSYVTLAYDLSRYVKNTMIKGLKCSLTGTNLFLLTKYTGSDPQINSSTSAGGTGAMGIDNYPVPNTRGFNFTLNANF